MVPIQRRLTEVVPAGKSQTFTMKKGSS